MLINLSNHPFTKWSDSQKKIAFQEYRMVEDMDFPYIDPLWSIKEVHRLAVQICDDIEKERPSAVHIMGEMTFTYTLVNLLKDVRILCIASTTERKVEEVDGKKVSTFEFVQFREY